MALAATAHGQLLLLFQLHFTTAALLVAGNAGGLPVGAMQCKTIVRETRCRGKALGLAVAADTVATKRAGMHVFVAASALLRESQEAPPGRWRHIISMWMAAHASQLRVGAAQFERHMTVVIATHIADPSALECVRRQQRRGIAMVFRMAQRALRLRQRRMQAGLQNGLLGNRGMALQARRRRDGTITVATRTVGATLKGSHRSMRRMQRTRSGIRPRQIPPSKDQHRRQRQHRYQPAHDLHLPASPKRTPRSTPPKRTAYRMCTAVSVNSNTANHRCSQRQVDSRPRRSS